MDLETSLYLVFFALLVVGLGAMIFGTIFKSRFGVNLRRLTCPNCGAAMPLVRVPKSTSQFLWGGATCPKCGCEVDKWGRRIAG